MSQKVGDAVLCRLCGMQIILMVCETDRVVFSTGHRDRCSLWPIEVEHWSHGALLETGDAREQSKTESLEADYKPTSGGKVED